MSAADNPADQDLGRYIQVDDDGFRHTLRGEFLVEKLSLAEGSGVTIQHEPPGAIRLADSVSHDPIDDLIANQAAGGDDRFRFQTQRGTRRYFGTQHFAGGNGGDLGLQPFDNHAPLRSFAGTGGAKEENNQTPFMIR